MELINESLPGLLELKMVVHEDNRARSVRAFNGRTMAGFGIEETFVQDNESRSVSAGTVRGLHFQVDPHAQGKLVRVLRGAIFDVALDLRPDSPTYLQHSTIELAEDDFRVFGSLPASPMGSARSSRTRRCRPRDRLLPPRRRAVDPVERSRVGHRMADQPSRRRLVHQGRSGSVLRRLPRELT